MVQEGRTTQGTADEDSPDSDGAEEGVSQEEEGEEGAFHSLRHVKRYAKEACRALDAAEAAVDGGQARPKMTAALRRCALTPAKHILIVWHVNLPVCVVPCMLGV